jgi:hypothetical protein
VTGRTDLTCASVRVALARPWHKLKQKEWLDG